MIFLCGFLLIKRFSINTFMTRAINVCKCLEMTTGISTSLQFSFLDKTFDSLIFGDLYMFISLFEE